jgi:hypothetical protein
MYIRTGYLYGKEGRDGKKKHQQRKRRHKATPARKKSAAQSAARSWSSARPRPSDHRGFYPSFPISCPHKRLGEVRISLVELLELASIRIYGST